MYERDGHTHTDRQTHTAWQHRSRLHSITRQKLAEMVTMWWAPPYTCAKVRHDPPKGFVSTHERLRTKSVYSVSFFLVFFVLGVLATRNRQGLWTDFDANTPQLAVPRKNVLFRGLEHKIEYLDDHFLPFLRISAISGPFLTGLRNFSPKNRLAMRLLPLEHLSILIVDA